MKQYLHPLDPSIWPESVDLVEAGDMTCGRLRRGERRCAMGHYFHQVTERMLDKGIRSLVWYDREKIFCDTFKKAAKELYPDRRIAGSQGVAGINDSVLKNNKERARVLNRTWELLGYTEVSEEEER